MYRPALRRLSGVLSDLSAPRPNVLTKRQRMTGPDHYGGKSEFNYQMYGKILRDDRCTYQEIDLMDNLMPGKICRLER